MNQLTKIAATALAATLVLGASPAFAAQWDKRDSARAAYGQNYRDHRGLGNEIAQLARQVDRAEQRGRISVREAARLDRNVDRLRQLNRQYARGGYTRQELRTIQWRIDEVQQQLLRDRADRSGHRR